LHLFFSLVAFLLLLLFLHLPFVRVLKVHLGLLYALAWSRSGLGAWWGPIGMNWGCHLELGL